MPASLIGLDQAELVRRLMLIRAVDYIFFEGERFQEPEPSTADAAPVDWIVGRLLRSDSTSDNVENAQYRTIRFAVWLALQPGRTNFQARLDAITASADAAFGFDQNTPGYSMDGTVSYLGPSAPPAGLETAQRWSWRANFYDGTFFAQV